MSDVRKQALEAMSKDKDRGANDLKKPSSIYESYFDAPEEIPVWFAKAGEDKPNEYFVDIVIFPYTENFPNEPWKSPYRKGDWPYTSIQYIHKNVGPENAWVICPKQNYLERCPICERSDALQKEIYKDESLTPEQRKAKAKKVWEEHRTYRRQLYYIVVRDGGEEEDKGLQLWEVPTVYMHEPLDAIKVQTRTGEVIAYYHPGVAGKTVRFLVKKDGDYAKFTGHQFEERVDPQTKEKYEVEDEFLELAAKYPIGDLLKRLSYDEIYEMFYESVGKEEKEETKEEQPTRSRRKRVTQQEETPPEKEETKEEPPAEPEGGGRRRRRFSEQKEEKPKNPCPNDFEFGKDCLSSPKCDECDDDLYGKCEDEKKRLEEEAAKAAASSSEEGGGRRRRRAVH